MGEEKRKKGERNAKRATPPQLAVLVRTLDKKEYILTVLSSAVHVALCKKLRDRLALQQDVYDNLCGVGTQGRG